MVQVAGGFEPDVLALGLEAGDELLHAAGRRHRHCCCASTAVHSVVGGESRQEARVGAETGSVGHRLRPVPAVRGEEEPDRPVHPFRKPFSDKLSGGTGSRLRLLSELDRSAVVPYQRKKLIGDHLNEPVTDSTEGKSRSNSRQNIV